MALDRGQGSSSLADLVGTILDKGIVIDAWIRVSIIGIQILTIEARVIVASVETYLKYAEAIGIATAPVTVSMPAPPVAATVSLPAPTVTVAAPALHTAALSAPGTQHAEVIASTLQESSARPKE